MYEIESNFAKHNYTDLNKMVLKLTSLHIKEGRKFPMLWEGFKQIGKKVNTHFYIAKMC